MKKVAAGLCCFLGAWTLLSLLAPLRATLWRPFGFSVTLAFLGAALLTWIVVKAIK